MHTATRLRQIAPYVVILAVGIALYAVADRIAYMEIPGQIGPDRWPKLIIALMIAVSVFEIGRRLMTAPVSEVASSEPSVSLEDEQPETPWMVFGAVAITIAYLLLLDVVGFVVGTLFYVAGLMWFGGTRRPTLVAVMSLVITAVFAFVFMKLIYVALPQGKEPFSWISFAVIKLIGV